MTQYTRYLDRWRFCSPPASSRSPTVSARNGQSVLMDNDILTLVTM